MRKFTVVVGYVDCLGQGLKEEVPAFFEEHAGPAMERAEAYVKSRHHGATNLLCLDCKVEHVVVDPDMEDNARGQESSGAVSAVGPREANGWPFTSQTNAVSPPDSECRPKGRDLRRRNDEETEREIEGDKNHHPPLGEETGEGRE